MQLQRDRAGNLGYCTTLSLCPPLPSSSFIRFVRFVSCLFCLHHLPLSHSLSVLASLSGFGSCDCAGPTTAIHKYRKIVSKRVSSRQRQRLPRADCDGASDKDDVKYLIDTNTIYLASHRWNVNVNYLASCPNKTPYSVYYIILANRKPKWLLSQAIVCRCPVKRTAARRAASISLSVHPWDTIRLLRSKFAANCGHWHRFKRLALSNIKRKTQCNCFIYF